MSDPNVTDEELTTAFSGAEALINKPPLTHKSADPRDNTLLTSVVYDGSFGEDYGGAGVYSNPNPNSMEPALGLIFCEEANPRSVGANSRFNFCERANHSSKGANPRFYLKEVGGS